MEFFKEEEKEVCINTYTQSIGTLFEECPLKAWFTVRNKEKAYSIKSRPLQVGIYTHELFAKSVADYIGEEYKILKNDDVPPSIKFESKMLIKRADIKKICPDKNDIMDFEEMYGVTLDNGIRLNGKFDLLMHKTSEYGSYMEVFDLKTSHKLSDDDYDLQTLIYVYLTALKFGTNVAFTKYSCRTSEKVSRFYFYADAMEIKSILEEESMKVKKALESREMPKPKASAKCLECPFLDECTAKEACENNLEDLMNEMQWSLAKAKRTEEEIKSLREVSNEDLSANGFNVVEKESKRRTLKAGSKKLSKKDVLVLLLSSGEADQYIEDLDLKYSDELIDKIRSFGIDVETSISRRVAIEK